MTSDLWTDAQKRAWDYVKASNNLDLTQSAGLETYRAGGGKIRTSDWGELWHRYQEGSQQWDRLYQFKSNDVLPESMYTQVNIKYQEKYVMTFTSSIRNAEGEILHDVKRQVESPRKMTLSQWSNAANDSLKSDISHEVEEVLDITDVQFYERMG